MNTPVSIGTGGSSSTTSSVTITTTAAIAIGDTVWVALVTGATAPTSIGITDSGSGGSNSYNNTDYPLNANNVTVFKAVATKAVALGGTLTIALTGGTSACAAVAFKQPAETMTLDGSVFSSANITDPVTGSANVTGGDLAIVVNPMFGGETSVTISAPFTLIDKSTNSSRGISVSYYEPATTGTPTFTADWNATHGGQYIVLNYAPPASVLDLAGAPASGGASAIGGTLMTSNPSSLHLGTPAAPSGATALAGQLEFDYFVSATGGAAANPGSLTLGSATSDITGAPATAGSAAQFGTLDKNTTGHVRLGGGQAASGATVTPGLLSLAKTLARAASGASAVGGKLTQQVPSEVFLGIGRTDRDQWSFDRADE